jgi:hypothetical protein
LAPNQEEPHPKDKRKPIEDEEEDKEGAKREDKGEAREEDKGETQ